MKKLGEKELIKLSVEQINLFEKEAAKELSIIEEFTNFFPCLIHLNNYSDLSINYMNKLGLERFQKSLGDILSEGIDFVQTTVDPLSTNIVVPKLFNFMKANDKDRTLFFEQRVRYSLNAKYINHLSFATLSDTYKSVLTFSFPSSLIEEFIRKRIFQENPLYSKYAERFFILTKREKEILRYIALGKTNQEIGNMLCLSKLTIKTHRQNIIKKLQTNSITELTIIALSFDLLKEN